MTPGSDPSSGAALADEARGPLAILYRELDAAVAELAPVCRLSGRCCRFEEYGHTLFLSAPEAAVLVADAPAAARPLDAGRTCPWQDDRGRCTAREARPLGCRVYFCDPAFEDQAPILTERFLSRLKELVDARGWPWSYAPLHRHLHSAVERGEFAPPSDLAGGDDAIDPREAGSQAPAGPA
ncbi:hypothetical protein [Paludisphaera mucosa]|uniref:YkgJ family cysteine cluster protein n=1 Tax=Paludisphaera mucosa TaxID=3030827 RepID=A0ABT6F5P2_9BACT|nr:hypothetical protein [Paludisphaera mucosa]MDG3002901.1 hypothetical protein [Paludisphaera mucosa]